MVRASVQVFMKNMDGLDDLCFNLNEETCLIELNHLRIFFPDPTRVQEITYN